MLTFLALLCLLALFMAFRMPIAFAMGLVGFFGLALQLGWRPAFAVLERAFFDSSSSFILVAIPLFILMAELLTSGDVTRRAILACQAWIGHVKGGLAMATVASSVLLAALVGSSTASTAAMAASAFPEMRNHNYADRLAAAVVSDPKVLILDEALNGLDPPSAARVKEFLRARCANGTAVLLSTHVLETVERIADRVVMLAHGRVVADHRVDEIGAEGLERDGAARGSTSRSWAVEHRGGHRRGARSRRR